MSGPVTIAELRQRVAARVVDLPWQTDAWGAGAMWEAPVPYDLFGVSQVPDAIPATKAHGAFTIGIGSTRFEGRATPGKLVVAITEVRVRFLARHTPGPTKSKASEYAAAAIEQALLEHLNAVTGLWPGLPAFHLTIDSVPTRSCPPPGNWFVHEARATARHPFRL